MPVETSREFLTSSLQTLEAIAAARKTAWGRPVPDTATPVFVYGYQVAPAYGSANQEILCSYVIPRGFVSLISGLVLGYTGGGGSALPGQVLYTVDVNNPNTLAVANQLGYTEKDFGSVGLQLGELVGGAVWPVEFSHSQNETLRVKAQTVSGVPVGAGNFVFAALVGFQWPATGREG